MYDSSSRGSEAFYHGTHMHTDAQTCTQSQFKSLPKKKGLVIEKGKDGEPTQVIGWSRETTDTGTGTKVINSVLRNWWTVWLLRIICCFAQMWNLFVIAKGRPVCAHFVRLLILKWLTYLTCSLICIFSFVNSHSFKHLKVIIIIYAFYNMV